jgi:hypothetical protein
LEQVSNKLPTINIHFEKVGGALSINRLAACWIWIGSPVVPTISLDPTKNPSNNGGFLFLALCGTTLARGRRRRDPTTKKGFSAAIAREGWA